MCISPNGYFPYLVRFLASRDMPLDYPEDIMRALEFPVYFDKLSDLIKEAWHFHFDDLGAYFELTMTGCYEPKSGSRREPSPSTA